MKKIVLLLLLMSSVIFSQQLDMTKLKGIEPRAIGPAGMSGRITAIDAVNSNPDIIYAGAASGGVWKSESGGIDWQPIFEKEAVSSIGAIAIQQSNPDVVWVGTGEGNPRNSLNGGYGIYKSLDAGKTWKLMGLEKTRNIHKIIVDPQNPNTVYVAAIGSPWGAHLERGIFKTTDGGKSWQKILFVNTKTGAADLVIDPNNPNKLIAAMWEHQRQPYFFKSGGAGSGLYITYDGGENWKKLSDKDGLPKGDLGRIGVAIAPSNPAIVYALVEAEKNALYRSEDGGFKWTMVNDKSSGRGADGIGNRPFYYSTLAVDSKNENRVYTIFTYVNVSEDGGKSFSQLMPAYGTSVGVHPDHHAWYINPENPNLMIDGNDGGLNITRDRGKTWRFAENIPVGQFYHINVDNDFPYHVYGGMQDNGSWIGPGYVLKAQGIRNSYWQELMFGDGFDVVPDPKDSRFGYGMSQEGYVGRYDRLTGDTRIIRPTHPNPDINLRFNWNSAIAMDPFDSNTIYFGSQFVHKSTNQGFEWELISPDLTTNNPEKQKQYESGGLTMDATGAENYGTIIAITPSLLEKGVIWIGSDDGNVQLTKNGGTSWTNLTENLKGLPKNSWITQIKVSALEPAEAYVVANNYRNFDFKPYLFRTRNYGKTWESLLTDNPETFGFSLSLIQDPQEKQLLFLGTEAGLYVSIDEGKNWTKWTNHFPTVPTMDLAIQPREDDLAIATFGRAMWVLDDIKPLRELARKGLKLLDQTIAVFPAPTAYLPEIQQPSGTRFGANAIFNGENKKFGAMLTYSINKPKTEEKDQSAKDDKSDDADKSKVNYKNIIVKIYDSNNILIRTLKEKTPEDSGVHRMYWRLDEKGVNNPSRTIRKSENEPGGVSVLPGDYKIVMQFGEAKDSTKITVKYDLRKTMPLAILKSKRALQKQVESKMELAYNAIKQVIDSKKIVDTYQNTLKEKKEKQYEALIKQNDSISKTLDGLLDAMFGKEDKRQGITATKDPSNLSYLYLADEYISSLQTEPGKTEQILLANANAKVDAVIAKINDFFKTDWAAYRTKMEALKLSPFNEVKVLK
ncbi:MAG: hypothetical protein AUJ53_02455 [Flavobacteriaceae bacterium CG1_02_35_72]|nr:MAG: hypothetical protein AUJ53_02455 [Flavobacteriaceae bacterium CG1_02_35_72]